MLFENTMKHEINLNVTVSGADNVLWCFSLKVLALVFYIVFSIRLGGGNLIVICFGSSRVLSYFLKLPRRGLMSQNLGFDKAPASGVKTII